MAGTASRPVVYRPGLSAPSRQRQLEDVRGQVVELGAAGLAAERGLDARAQAGIGGLTANPAEIFALPEGHGTLSEGAPADFVIWSGDPFEFSTRVEHVLIRGREVREPSRQDLLIERYLPKSPRSPQLK